MLEVVNSTVAIVVALISLIGLIFSMVKARADAKGREKEIANLRAELEVIKKQVSDFTTNTFQSLEQSIEEASHRMDERTHKYYQMMYEMERNRDRHYHELLNVENSKGDILDQIQVRLNEIKEVLEPEQDSQD